MQLYEVALTRRLYIIATVGTNALYVGLLGTVLGIMYIFYAMGMDGGANVNTIMTGFVTAIPAIVLYNVLLRRANELILIKGVEYEGKKL